MTYRDKRLDEEYRRACRTNSWDANVLPPPDHLPAGVAAILDEAAKLRGMVSSAEAELRELNLPGQDEAAARSDFRAGAKAIRDGHWVDDSPAADALAAKRRTLTARLAAMKQAVRDVLGDAGCVREDAGRDPKHTALLRKSQAVLAKKLDEAEKAYGDVARQASLVAWLDGQPYVDRSLVELHDIGGKKFLNQGIRWETLDGVKPSVVFAALASITTDLQATDTDQEQSA